MNYNSSSHILSQLKRWCVSTFPFFDYQSVELIQPIVKTEHALVSIGLPIGPAHRVKIPRAYWEDISSASRLCWFTLACKNSCCSQSSQRENDQKDPHKHDEVIRMLGKGWNEDKVRARAPLSLCRQAALERWAFPKIINELFTIQAIEKIFFFFF